MSGRLIIVATPIGNLADISKRALDALQNVDTILAEDTRVTSKLLAHYGLEVRLERCDENIIVSRSAAIVERLLKGERIAFCSDAGTPGVSDPGMVLVKAAYDAGVTVEVIPGASAVLTALAASGFCAPSFFFGGFLPRKSNERKTYLESLGALDAVLIFYESPHRTLASLETIASVFPLREAVLARELTKLHEEVLRANSIELAQQIASRQAPLKGEVVLLVGPPDAKERTQVLSDEELLEQAKELLNTGLSKSDAAKRLAAITGVAKNHLYNLILNI